MKRFLMVWCWCCFLQVVDCQTIMREQHFFKLEGSIQSIVSLSEDSLRVGGVNADGGLEWMDFNTQKGYMESSGAPIRMKMVLDFQPTALHFLNAQQVFLAGHRHHDRLAWAILNLNDGQKVQSGLLPDSLRKGQINVIRRLRNGELVFGGKKKDDLLLVRADSLGKVREVLHRSKALKDEIFDLFETERGEIYAAGALNDDVFEQNLMYILRIDSALTVNRFKIAGESDSVNVAYSTVTTSNHLLVIGGVSGRNGVVMWLDANQEVVQRQVLPSKIGFKRVRVERVEKSNIYRVWATDKADKLHLFLIKN